MIATYMRLCARCTETVAIPKKSPGLHKNSCNVIQKFIDQLHGMDTIMS